MGLHHACVDRVVKGLSSNPEKIGNGWNYIDRDK
jgi:hypothetical protein